jgi:hypothetical protein
VTSVCARNAGKRDNLPGKDALTHLESMHEICAAFDSPEERTLMKRQPSCIALLLTMMLAQPLATFGSAVKTKEQAVASIERQKAELIGHLKRDPAGYFVLLAPRFSYHFRFVVAVPMQTISGLASPFKSATAHPAAPMPPSSRICRDHRLAFVSSAE